MFSSLGLPNHLTALLNLLGATLFTAFVLWIAALLVDRSKSEPKCVYFPVTMSKFAVMSWCTLGLYQYFWMYMNWRRVNAHHRKTYRPLIRTAFSALTIYSLLKKIQQTGIEIGFVQRLLPGVLAASWIIWVGACNIRMLPREIVIPITLLTFVPLLPAQHYVNKLNSTVNPQCEKNDRLSLLNWIAILLGTAFHFSLGYVAAPSLVSSANPVTAIIATGFLLLALHSLISAIRAKAVQRLEQLLMPLAACLLIFGFGWLDLYAMHHGEGELWMVRGDNVKAIDHLNRAIALYPGNASDYGCRAIVRDREAAHEQVIQDVTRAIALNPREASHRNLFRIRAKAYRSLDQKDNESKNWKEAVSHYTHSIAAHPQESSEYAGRGAAFWNLKQYPQAVDDFTRAIDLVKGGPYYLVARAEAYQSLDQQQKALEDYTRALELDSGFLARDPQVYRNLGDAMAAVGEFEKAIDEYSTAIDLEPVWTGIWSSDPKPKAFDRADTYMRRADAYDKVGKQELATYDRNAAKKLSQQAPKD